MNINKTNQVNVEKKLKPETCSNLDKLQLNMMPDEHKTRWNKKRTHGSRSIKSFPKTTQKPKSIDHAYRSRKSMKIRREREKKKKKLANGKENLAIGGAIIFNDPASLKAESFQDFIIITMFRKFKVPLSSKSCINLSSYGSSPPLSSLIILSLLPSRQPSWTSTGGHFARRTQPPTSALLSSTT